MRTLQILENLVRYQDNSDDLSNEKFPTTVRLAGDYSTVGIMDPSIVKSSGGSKRVRTFWFNGPSTFEPYYNLEKNPVQYIEKLDYRNHPSFSSSMSKQLDVIEKNTERFLGPVGKHVDVNSWRNFTAWKLINGYI